MLGPADMEKKQSVFVFFNRGEKLSFSNDNFAVRDAEGKIKFQCTCHRLFIVFAVGYGSVTGGLMQRAKKFGFSIVMMTPGFKPYQIIGAPLEGNTLLRKAQYSYASLDLAKHITKNKLANQRRLLSSLRNKNDLQHEAIKLIDGYISGIDDCGDLRELMGLEGMAARVYFRNYFNNVIWKGRMPRIKPDMTNALLDIGYTILFSFVEALLSCYGFDLYCGVMHRNFYMRKSLVCDIVEPFRVLVDAQVRKAVSLRQFREEDFIIRDGKHILKWEKSSEYAALLAKPVIDNRGMICSYIRDYYRAFVRCKPASEFPVAAFGGSYDTDKL